MYFVMSYLRVDGKVYQHRRGKATTNWGAAKRLCAAVNGAILNEKSEMLAQAFDVNLPRHVSVVKEPA